MKPPIQVRLRAEPGVGITAVPWFRFLYLPFFVSLLDITVSPPSYRKNYLEQSNWVSKKGPPDGRAAR